MITRYRNKGLIRLAISFCLEIIAFIVGVGSYNTDWHKLGGFIGVVSFIIGAMIYAFGCTDLLRAKGYDSSMSLAFMIPAFCCSNSLIIIAPIIIIFVLKDKTKNRG